MSVEHVMFLSALIVETLGVAHRALDVSDRSSRSPGPAHVPE